MRNTVLTVMAVTAGAVGLGAIGDIDPSSLTVRQRFVWEQGFQKEVELNILPEGFDTSIVLNSVLPEGAILEVRNNKIFLTWTPAALGTFEIPIQITAVNPPPFVDWTGPMIVRTTTIKIQIYVYVTGDSDFTVTGPDILIGP
jgi:hypothetical protein